MARAKIKKEDKIKLTLSKDEALDLMMLLGSFNVSEELTLRLSGIYHTIYDVFPEYIESAKYRAISETIDTGICTRARIIGRGI